MKILNPETKMIMVDISEIELIHYGLTEMVGKEKTIKDLKGLLEIKWKGDPTLRFEDDNKITLIRSESAFKMIIETLYNQYQENPDMKVRFE